MSPWFAVFAPAATPRAAIAKLNEELARALKLGDVEAKLAAIGAEPIGSTPEALASHLKTETTRWSAIIKARNIRAD